MELPEYIEKCRQITDACGWLEAAKDMALRNAILIVLKNRMVYQKCLEENQDTLTVNRVIEIATVYNNDCQRSILQILSTASAAATAIQQGSTQVHNWQATRKSPRRWKIRKGTGKMSLSKTRMEWNEENDKCPAKYIITMSQLWKKGHYQKCCKRKRAKPGKNSKFKQTQVHDLQTQPVDGNSQPAINPFPGHHMPLELPQQYSSQPALFHHI